MYHLTVDEKNGIVDIFLMDVTSGCDSVSCKVNAVSPEGNYWTRGKGWLLNYAWLFACFIYRLFHSSIVSLID